MDPGHAAAAGQTSHVSYVANLVGRGALQLAEAIKEGGTLKSVDLNNCQISEEGLQRIAEALHGNQSLLALTIHHTLGYSDPDGGLFAKRPAMCTQTAKHFADALVHNRVLTILNLRSNVLIGDCGARYLAAALKQNKVLLDLNLSQTGLSDEGVWLLADALRANTTLRFLDVRGNDVGEEGQQRMRQIGMLLAKNKCAEQHLVLNLIPQAPPQAEKPMQVQLVTLGGNDFGRMELEPGLSVFDYHMQLEEMAETRVVVVLPDGTLLGLVGGRLALQTELMRQLAALG